MPARWVSASRLLLLFGVLQAALFAWYFAQSIHPIPRWDFFDWITGYLEQDAFGQWLWALHNEHRIVFSKLVVALDIEWFAGQLYPIAFLTVVTLVIWLSVLTVTVIGNMDMTANARVAITGAVLLLGFPTFTLDNYAYPTIMQFAFVTCFFVLAIGCFLKTWRLRQAGDHAAANLWFCLGLLFAVCCTVSSLNGLFVWIVLAWMTWRLGGYSKGELAALAVAGFSIVTVYLWHFSATEPGQYYMQSIGDVFGFLKYLCAYFGMPWVAVPHLELPGLLLGGTLFAIACGAVVWKGLLAPRIAVVEVLGVALLMFSGLTALATSFARMGVADLPAHRYTLFAVIAHFGFFLLLLPPLLRIDLARKWPRALPLAVFVIGSALLLQQVVVGQFAARRAEHFALLRDRILAGDRTVEVTSELYPDPGRLEYHLALLAKRKLSIYSPGGG